MFFDYYGKLNSSLHIIICNLIEKFFQNAGLLILHFYIKKYEYS
jgi:hypothetical protein